jgi:hypothetical protein
VGEKPEAATSALSLRGRSESAGPTDPAIELDDDRRCRGSGERLSQFSLGHQSDSARLGGYAARCAHRVPLIVIQRQLGHSNLGVTSIYLQGIDNAERIETVHARRAHDPRKHIATVIDRPSRVPLVARSGS